MDDKKLLELAAYAAGYRAVPNQIGDKWWGDWYPLTDTTDALKLALLLGISLEIDAIITVGTFEYEGYKESEFEYGVEAWHVDLKTAETTAVQEVYGEDKVAAVCRAIVRCAAMLGI